MIFKNFFFALSPADRLAFAKRALTSVKQLQQVAYRFKHIELGFADVIVSVSGGRIQLRDLPLTPRAKRQMTIRRDGVAHAD